MDSDPSLNAAPRLRYGKRMRLRGMSGFRFGSPGVEVFPGRECVVRRIPNDVGHPRLGIAAPQGYGNAVKRNRLRRLVREALRALQHELGSYDFLVAPRRGLDVPTLEGIRHDLIRTLTARPTGRRTGSRGKPK